MHTLCYVCAGSGILERVFKQACMVDALCTTNA